MMYGTRNVFDVALDRIDYLFDEFENIIVDFSGGKDSTVTLNLALQIAEKKGRIPLPVLFIDQETEWDSTIDYVEKVMSDPRVKPVWMQGEFKLFNATSLNESWLTCWEESKSDIWIREKNPIAVDYNPTNCDRFKELFSALGDWYFNGQKYCHLAGVRCEESPTRKVGLTTQITYKWITWGKVDNKLKKQYTFYPLYDWSYKDIWKSILDNHWTYSKMYDYMYQYGTPVKEMRVSSVIHETSTKSLYFLPEVEPRLWNKLTARLDGINTAGKLNKDFQRPKELPAMFESWKEYRDFLCEKLITNPNDKFKMKKMFKQDDNKYDVSLDEKLHKMQIDAILVNDYHGTKMASFRAANRNQRKKSC